MEPGTMPPPPPSSKVSSQGAPPASVSAPSLGNEGLRSVHVLRALTSLSALSARLTKSMPSSLTPHTESARAHARTLWTSTKPWNEFLDTRKFNTPSSPSELQQRLMDNLTYFSGNYVVCFLAVSCLSVLIHPLSFLCVLLLAAVYVFMFVQHPDVLQVGPFKLTPNAKLATFACVSLLLLYATNAVGIIGSWALFGVIVSLLHAGFRASATEPDFDSPVNSV